MGTLFAATKVATLPDVDIAHSLIQMVLALAVVVACIWGLSKVLAWVKSGPKGGASTKRRADTSGLQVISRQSLGKDLAIASVRWGEREVLVGIAGSTITFLTEPSSERPIEQARSEADHFTESIREKSSAHRDEAILAERSEIYAPRAPREREAVLSGARSGGRGSSSPSPSLIESLRNATIRR